MTQATFKTCFDQFFEPIRNYVYYRSGNASLATDIAQEVFMKLWEKQINFSPKKTKALLYKMAGDLFIDHLRKNKVASNYVSHLKLNLNNTPQTPEQTLRYKELKNNYEIALAKLPEKQRTVFLMSRIESLTYKEIAQRLNLSVKAIEKRMHLAINQLKEQLQYHEK